MTFQSEHGVRGGGGGLGGFLCAAGVQLFFFYVFNAEKGFIQNIWVNEHQIKP